MLSLSELIFKGFQENTEYGIIHILDLVINADARNKKDILFRILFQDLKNEKYYRIRHIPPYLLKNFSLGTIVSIEESEIKKKLNIQLTGIVYDVTLSIPQPDKQIIKKIGELINDKEYPLNIKFYVNTKDGKKEIDLTSEIRNQYCITIEKEDNQIIFPISVIGANFFFITQRFTEDLFNLNLGIEYHNINTQNQSIHMKGGYNDINAPFLYLYATNPVAKKVYDSLGKQLLSKFQEKHNIFSKAKYPLKLYFPFSNQNINFKLRGEWIAETKFLVFDIEKFEMNKVLGIDRLMIVRTEKESNPQKKLSFFSKKDSKHTNEINDNIKADESEFFEELEKEIDSIEDENFQIEKKKIPYPHKSVNIKRIPLKEKSNDKQKDLTYQKYNPNLESEGKETNVETNEKLDVSNSFSLDDFLRYFYKVCFEIGISKYNIMRFRKKLALNYLKNPKFSPYKSKSKDIREYLVLKFKYNGKSFTIIELDHIGISAQDTNKLHTLIFTGSRYLSDKEAFNVIHSYFGKAKSLKEIEKYFITHNISLTKKKHPRTYNEKGVKNWINTFTEILRYKI